MTDRPDGSRRRGPQIWGRVIPFRNRYFTGREAELSELRNRLSGGSTAVLSQPPQPVYGLGGVGKTEIATEYAYRHADEYDVVWWVGAENEDLVRNSLVALGRRLDLPALYDDDRDRSSDIVLDALRRGEPYARWLLIFDNVTRPDAIARYIPRGEGHVIITSRIQRWQRTLRTDGIEVGEFSRAETVDFLRKRVPRLAGDDGRAGAESLADTLDNLPLAAEHAAAYLNETGASVEEYLRLFEENASRLLGFDVDIAYPRVVATTWSVARGEISPEADELFHLLAFFSAEPISEELFVQPSRVSGLAGPLGRVLGDLGEARRAVRELARFSLLRVYGRRNVVQLHRVVQAVTRSSLERGDPEHAGELTEIVHMLLAASDPGIPEDERYERTYDLSRQHLVPSGAIDSANPQTRRLIINQVRRLHLHDRHTESLSLGNEALVRWREKLGPNDLQTLSLAIQVAVALRGQGRDTEAFELDTDTMTRLREEYGEENDRYLTCARSYGTGLRTLGRYAEALDHDQALLPTYERVFRAEHYQTLAMRNNIAIDLRCMGRFAEAFAMDDVTTAERERTLGHTAIETLGSRFGVARDLRRLGDYDRALDVVRDIVDVMDEKGMPWRLFRLMVMVDLSVSLRRAGYYDEARAQAEDSLARHHALAGPAHRQSLMAATNLINDRRLTESLDDAQELGEVTVRDWIAEAGADHPNTQVTRANLAIVLRRRGNPAGAREIDAAVLDACTVALGPNHPNSLVTATNLASDMAAMGDVRAARELGEWTSEAAALWYGDTHPVTLAARANLAGDRRACGDDEGAARLREQAVAGYRERLTDQHPQTRLAVQHGRIDLDLEIMSI